MIRIDSSKVHCGNCHKTFPGNWELDIIDSHEREMGEETEYEGVLEEICPYCGNNISGKLHAYEYPVGNIDEAQIQVECSDTRDTSQSRIDNPQITLFDL